MAHPKGLTKGKRKDTFLVHPAVVKVREDFNIRVDYGDIEELAQSILENGLKMPLIAKWHKEDEYWLLNQGHRRLKAVNLLHSRGHTDILVIIVPEPRKYDDSDRYFDMITTNSGKNLSLLEEAYVYRKLSELSLLNADIARRVGKSHTHIVNCETLLTSTTETQQMILGGKVAATTVLDMLKNGGAPEEVEGTLKHTLESTGKEKVTKKHIEKKEEKSKPKIDEKSLEWVWGKVEEEEKAGTQIDEWSKHLLKRVWEYQAGDINLAELMNDLVEGRIND